MSNPESITGWKGAKFGEEVTSSEVFGNASSLYKFELKYWYATNVNYDISSVRFIKPAWSSSTL